MAVLLTGGAGKTSSTTAKYLQDANIPFIMTSRKGQASALPGMHAAKFDFSDASTYDAPYEHESLKGTKIISVYLVMPEVQDPVAPMNAFIDHAVNKHGVKRFVLFTGTTATLGGPQIGQVWKHLDDLKVEYCVLRASWLMENFSVWQFVESINKEGKIYTACGDGKIPFISADDIGRVAMRCLTDKKLSEGCFDVIGPELLTYDEAAAKFSHALGRPIQHVKLTQDETVQQYQKIGLPLPVAGFMAWLEQHAAEGAENRMNDNIERATGKAPMTLDTWIEANKSAWP